MKTTSFNASIKKVFKIDVGSISREQAEKSLAELMRSYKEDFNPWCRLI